ncbi:MAG: DUF2817 domain-containing protein [Nevskia sp.]|nr:DUF2817 domain-containing protein [Nevskia sp.]
MGGRDLSCYSESYREARTKLLAESANAGLPVISYMLPRLRGPEHEELATDIVEIIPASATRLVIVSTGVHGIEGYAGSAVQVEALRQGLLANLPDGTGAALVHGVNPWGMAHYCLANEDNIDINRNFLPAFEAAAPAGGIDPARTGGDIVSGESTHRSAGGNPERGLAGDLHAALSRGQHANRYGLFFGGHKPAWSNTTWRGILARYARGGCRRIIHVDIHTGPGTHGRAELICNFPQGTPAFDRARTIWGDAAIPPAAGGPPAPSAPTGSLASTLPDYATSITVEFGTKPVDEVLIALIHANRAFADGFRDQKLRARAMRLMRDAFCPDDRAWCRSVIDQSFGVIRKAVDGFQAVDTRPP